MESKRIRLRRFQLSDSKNMAELESDPEVMKFTSLRVPFTFEQTVERLESLVEKEGKRAPLGVWAAEFKDTGDFLGWFMLFQFDHLPSPELGFMIVRRHWGKGLTAEAAACLIDLGFNHLNFPTIIAQIDPANDASRKVLQKLGFAFVKTISTIDKVTKLDISLDVFELHK